DDVYQLVNIHTLPSPPNSLTLFPLTTLFLSRTANRIHKVLQDTNIKLSSVATDVLGVSGRAMLEALITGEEDPVKLAHLAQRKLRSKIPELEKALEGHLTEHHRFMLQLLWK